MEPLVIGQAVHKALTAPRPKIRYTIVKQKLKNWDIPQMLPKRTVDRLIESSWDCSQRQSGSVELLIVPKPDVARA